MSLTDISIAYSVENYKQIVKKTFIRRCQNEIMIFVFLIKIYASMINQILYVVCKF